MVCTRSGNARVFASLSPRVHWDHGTVQLDTFEPSMTGVDGRTQIFYQDGREGGRDLQRHTTFFDARAWQPRKIDRRTDIDRQTGTK